MAEYGTTCWRIFDGILPNNVCESVRLWCSKSGANLARGLGGQGQDVAVRKAL